MPGCSCCNSAAGRFLAPFIGSSVETWTCVIGVFLTGIALGNWLGGRIADRYPSPRTVAVLLILGGLSSLWMIAWYEFTLSSRASTSRCRWASASPFSRSCSASRRRSCS